MARAGSGDPRTASGGGLEFTRSQAGAWERVIAKACVPELEFGSE